MKKIHCHEEGYCYTEENGKRALLTVLNKRSFFVGIGIVLLGLLALATI